MRWSELIQKEFILKLTLEAVFRYYEETLTLAESDDSESAILNRDFAALRLAQR